jgi:hypothetical protein
MRSSAELPTDRAVEAATILPVCEWIRRAIERAAEGAVGVLSLEFKDEICVHLVKPRVIIVSAN